MSLPYIGMLERGDRAPGRDLCHRILEALGFRIAPTVGGVVPKTLTAEDPETGQQLHLRFTVSAAERLRKTVSTIEEYEAYARHREREGRPVGLSWTRPSNRHEAEDLEAVGPMGDSDLAEIVRAVGRMNPNELRLLARWVDLWDRTPDEALRWMAELPLGPDEAVILLQDDPPYREKPRRRTRPQPTTEEAHDELAPDVDRQLERLTSSEPSFAPRLVRLHQGMITLDYEPKVPEQRTAKGQPSHISYVDPVDGRKLARTSSHTLLFTQKELATELAAHELVNFNGRQVSVHFDTEAKVDFILEVAKQHKKSQRNNDE